MDLINNDHFLPYSQTYLTQLRFHRKLSNKDNDNKDNSDDDNDDDDDGVK